MIDNYGQVKSIFKLISRLSNVRRYSTNYLVKQESVLEHTGSVALLSATIGLFIKENTDTEIDLGKLMIKATYHDLEESETGDIPRLTKYHNDTIRTGLKYYEAIAIKKIEKYTKIPNLSDYWQTSKEGKEGLVVSIADLMCVTYKAYEEIVRLNNFNLKEVGFQSIKHYNALYDRVRDSRYEGIINISTEDYLLSVLDMTYEIAVEINRKLRANSLKDDD